MSDEQSKNVEIALWLGYRTHEEFKRNWFLPDAPEDAPGSSTFPLPDFHNNPVHYERIKAKMREIELEYAISYIRTCGEGDVFRLELNQDSAPSMTVYGWNGRNEGDVLVRCALALIERGLWCLPLGTNQ